MRELQQRQRFKRLLYSVPSLVLLSALTLVLAKGAVGVLSKERLSEEQARILSEEAEALALRKNELKDDIASLETETGINEEIRRRYSVTQEGEHLAIIVDAKKSATSTDEGRKPWYKRLWAVIIPF